MMYNDRPLNFFFCLFVLEIKIKLEKGKRLKWTREKKEKEIGEGVRERKRFFWGGEGERKKSKS